MLTGEIDKAQALFDRVVAIANDLGLLAEEFDTGAGRQTGNFPQALTHIALINTAHNLSAAKQADREAGDAAVEVALSSNSKSREPASDPCRCRLGLGSLPAPPMDTQYRLALADSHPMEVGQWCEDRQPRKLGRPVQ